MATKRMQESRHILTQELRAFSAKTETQKEASPTKEAPLKKVLQKKSKKESVEVKYEE